MLQKMELGLYGKNVLRRHSCGWVQFRMNDYILYMQESHDEQPLYIFDKKFVENLKNRNCAMVWIEIFHLITCPRFFPK